MTKPAPSRRIDSIALVAIGAITSLLVLMLGRVAQLQWSPGDRLGAGVQARQTRRPLPPVRGNILDRRGRLLAATEFGHRVFVDPVEFPPEPDEAIAVLADALGARPDSIGEVLIPKVAENDARRRVLESLGPHDEPRSHTPAWHALVRLASESTGTDGDPQASTDDSALSPAHLLTCSPAQAAPKPLIRYVRLTDAVPDEAISAVRRLKIPGVHVEQVPVRRYPAGSLGASIVGKVGSEHAGLLGAEFAENDALKGEQGRIRYVRDARGRPLWMDPDSYEQPRAGSDLRLALDLELQRMAAQELDRGIEEADAAGGRLIMMDAATGEVLAMVDVIRPLKGLDEFWGVGPRTATGPAAERRPTRYRTITPDPGRATHPALGRNRCVEDVYEPGSAFKAFVWATVLESGKARPGDVFDTHDGRWTMARGRYLEDVVKRPRMTWTEILLLSSNIGMVQGAARLTSKQLHDGIRLYGFGSLTGVGLPGESSGIVTSLKSWTHQTQTSVAFGAEVAVTPLQMVRAFAVFARDGALIGTLPSVRLIAPDRDDRAFVPRVVQPTTVALVREILAEVAHKMEVVLARKHPGENAWRYRIFGKSGTAKIALGKPPRGKRLPPGHKGYFDKQYNASFIAAGPLEQPRIVILAIIDDPGPETIRLNQYYGSHVAGPVVRRLMDRALAYLGVPPSPMPSVISARAAAPAGE